MVEEQEELIFLEKIEEQKWKIGTEVEGNSNKRKKVNSGKKSKKEKEEQVRNIETVQTSLS